MKIYLSSSWKNRDRVRAMAVKLREEYDATVYDFTDARTRGVPEIPPEHFPKQFAPEDGTYREYITSFPHWRAAVDCNRKALQDCDLILLILPCGNDAHADAFYGLGLGKVLVVVGQPKAGDRTPTHLWADAMLDKDEDIFILFKERRRLSSRGAAMSARDLVSISRGLHPYEQGEGGDPRTEECQHRPDAHCKLCLGVASAVEVFVGLRWIRGTVSEMREDGWLVQMSPSDFVIIKSSAGIRRYKYDGGEHPSREAAKEHAMKVAMIPPIDWRYLATQLLPLAGCASSCQNRTQANRHPGGPCNCGFVELREAVSKGIREELL